MTDYYGTYDYSNATFTIPDANVDEAKLKISNSPTNDYILTADSGVTGGMKWAAASSGGSSDSVNVEDLSGSKTLTAGTDKTIQYLNPNGANRTITVSTTDASEGDHFVIINNAAYNASYYLSIILDVTTVGRIFSQGKVEYVYSGSAWKPVTTGSFDGTSIDYNVSIGRTAKGYNFGTAVGFEAEGENFGTGVGNQCDASNSGVAVGAYAEGAYYGVGLGYNADTNNMYYSTALGYDSKCQRFDELTHSISHNSAQNNSWSVIGMKGDTTDATVTEVYCAGVTGKRLDVIANSSISFRAMVVARDDTNNKTKSWEVTGAIQQDGSSNTALVGSVTKTTIADSGVAWDVTFSADDGNEALKVEVTGAATTTIKWSIRVDTIEVRI